MLRKILHSIFRKKVIIISVILVFILLVTTFINKNAIIVGIDSPKIINKYFIGIICKKAINIHDTYPIHFTGLLFSLKLLKYSCIAIAATIANNISITYVFPYIKINATIGSPIIPLKILFSFIYLSLSFYSFGQAQDLPPTFFWQVWMSSWIFLTDNTLQHCHYGLPPNLLFLFWYILIASNKSSSVNSGQCLSGK